MGQNFKATIPGTIYPRPKDREIEVADILARHFKQPVTFIPPLDSYKIKTPDIYIGSVPWEIKSPQGSSKASTIKTQFKGLKQSRSLVIDGRYTNLSDDFILRQIKSEIIKRRRIQGIVFITKKGLVLVCK